MSQQQQQGEFLISDRTCITAQPKYMVKFTAYNGICHGAFPYVSLYDLSSSCLLGNLCIHGIETFYIFMCLPSVLDKFQSSLVLFLFIYFLSWNSSLIYGPYLLIPDKGFLFCLYFYSIFFLKPLSACIINTGISQPLSI